MTRTGALALLYLITIASVQPSAAEEKTTYLSADQVLGFPIILSAPGQYALMGNLLNPGSGLTIEITGSNIGLDLNGFRVQSAGTGPVVSAIGVDNIVIRNGAIIGLDDYVSITATQDVILEDLRLTGGGGGLAIDFEDVTNYQLRRLHIVAQVGMDITASAGPPYPFSGTIQDNVLEVVSQQAIRVSGGVSVGIRNNRIQGNGNGIRIQVCNGCLVEGNTIHSADSGIEAINLTGCKISNNVIAESNVDGISLSSAQACKVNDNAISQSGFFGIRVAGFDGDDNLILRNVINESGQDGIFVFSDRNHIEGNLMNSNTDYGLRFDADSQNNFYRANRAVGNGGTPGTCNGGLSSADFCDDSTAANNVSVGDNYMPDAR